MSRACWNARKFTLNAKIESLNPTIRFNNIHRLEENEHVSPRGLYQLSTRREKLGSLIRNTYIVEQRRGKLHRPDFNSLSLSLSLFDLALATRATTPSSPPSPRGRGSCSVRRDLHISACVWPIIMFRPVFDEWRSINRDTETVREFSILFADYTRAWKNPTTRAPVVSRQLRHACVSSTHDTDTGYRHVHIYIRTRGIPLCDFERMGTARCWTMGPRM